jgi:ribosome biogenesis GTPase
VYERKNTLKRPPLSNVDQIVLVLAPVPKPDFLLIDKLIINAKMHNIDVILVVNKSDVNNIYNDIF